jgi:hypothetical protein
MNTEDTVTIPRQVYEGYQGVAAAMIAATAMGLFENIDELTNQRLITLSKRILASGALK